MGFLESIDRVLTEDMYETERRQRPGAQGTESGMPAPGECERDKKESVEDAGCDR